MRVDLFDFELPSELIALRPADPRDAAKLLVVDEDGSLRQACLRDLAQFLRPGDVLVVNNSKVLPARLVGMRAPRPNSQSAPSLSSESEGALSQGAAVEITLHKRLAPQRFLAFAKPAKRLRAGDHLRFAGTLRAWVIARDGGEVELAFDCSGHCDGDRSGDGDGDALDAALEKFGEMPLPPYIASKRKPDARDRRDYQTIFAAHPGSVAAPTAGLHFTPALLERLASAQIARESVTLHVGPGTFLPVTAADTTDHRMHEEWAVLTEETANTLNAIRAQGGRIVAVGSTALRTLESAADDSGRLHAFSGPTELFLTPGDRFKAVDVLLTNFHLPRSTLFMLVAAFSGLEVMKTAYRQAVEARYRFYSYGDACLLFRSNA